MHRPPGGSLRAAVDAAQHGLELTWCVGSLTGVAPEIEAVTMKMLIEPRDLAGAVQGAPQAHHLILDESVHRIQHECPHRRVAATLARSGGLKRASVTA